LSKPQNDIIPGCQPFDPLEESALLAWETAPKMCRRIVGTGSTCAWYHGIWPYLRRLKIISAVDNDRGFFFDAYNGLARTGGYRRLLVAGAADHAMLAHLANAFRRAGITPRITVADICATPLLLNEWYAKKISLPIRVRRTSVFEYEPERPFDLLCTHSFMWHIPENRRTELMRKWWDLVRPGGRIVISQLVYSGTAAVWKENIQQRAEEFRDRVADAAERYGYLPEMTPASLGKLACEWRVRTIQQRRTLDAREMIGLLRSQGFTIERSEFGGYAGPHRFLTADQARNEPQRLRVIAVRH
jgi:SAM-dependent methyltransferase